MISSLEHTFIIATILLLNIELCICTCARAEYEINGECCPMCSPGSRVYRHCTETTSTTCMLCVGLTYTDEPNGLSSCLSCTVCDAGLGLKEKTVCARTSDTVCDPLEGFYCTEESKGSCRYAVEHTNCGPGQYIKQKGTAGKDTECAECAHGKYSNGSLQICKQHTRCEDLGLIEITPGTNSIDAECGRELPLVLITGILVTVLAVTILAIMGKLLLKRRYKRGRFRAVTTDNMRLSDNQSHKEISGYVASPAENDCDLQEHELYTAYDVT